jgi:hypothetical protein
MEIFKHHSSGCSNTWRSARNRPSRAGLSGTPTLPEFGDVDADATWIWAGESDADNEPHALHDLWSRAGHRSRETVASILAESGLDHAREGGMSLRRTIRDRIEEYARPHPPCHSGMGSLREPIPNR